MKRQIHFFIIVFIPLITFFGCNKSDPYEEMVGTYIWNCSGVGGKIVIKKDSAIIIYKSDGLDLSGFSYNNDPNGVVPFEWGRPSIGKFRIKADTINVSVKGYFASSQRGDPVEYEETYFYENGTIIDKHERTFETRNAPECHINNVYIKKDK